MTQNNTDTWYEPLKNNEYDDICSITIAKSEK